MTVAVGLVHAATAAAYLFLFVVAVGEVRSARRVTPFGAALTLMFLGCGSHHAVPGVATINQAPYFCRPHKLSFEERAAFIEHLSVKHGLTDREIPSMVLVEHNQVRYVGD